MSKQEGFRRSRKVFDMTFEEFPGLQIKAKSVPIGSMLEVLKLAGSISAKAVPAQEDIERLFGWFASRIVSWNYTDEDGGDLPATVETLLDDDFDFVMKLIMGWVSAVSSSLVPTMPGPDSSSSRSPLEESIPMTAEGSGTGT